MEKVRRLQIADFNIEELFIQKKRAEALIEEAYMIAGLHKSQNIRTEGTIYYIIGRICHELRLFYFDRLKAMNKFGFNVVSTMAKKRKKKTFDEA